MADNKFNKEETIARCVPMGRLQSVIGGTAMRLQWKLSKCMPSSDEIVSWEASNISLKQTWILEGSALW